MASTGLRRPSNREDAQGVANGRMRALQWARELTKQLQRHFEQSTVPVWIAVQNRGEDDPDLQYWVGRALSIKKVYEEAGNAGRVRTQCIVKCHQWMLVAPPGCPLPLHHEPRPCPCPAHIDGYILPTLPACLSRTI